MGQEAYQRRPLITWQAWQGLSAAGVACRAARQVPFVLVPEQSSSPGLSR